MIPLFIGPEALSTPVTNAIAADPVKIASVISKSAA
jgi:hypothetical protein